MIADSGIGCATCCWYHGGINMCELGVGHSSNDPTSGLNSGLLGGSPLGEFSSCDSPSSLLSSGWWVEPLGTWIGKLVLTYTMVGTSAVKGY